MFWLSHSIVILPRAGRVSCLRDEPCPSPHRWTKYELSLWRGHSVNNHWLMDDSVWSLTLKRGTWTVDKLLLCCSVVSVSLQPHGLQHSRFPCPSPSTGICLDLCISSRSKWHSRWSVGLLFCKVKILTPYCWLSEKNAMRHDDPENCVYFLLLTMFTCGNWVDMLIKDSEWGPTFYSRCDFHVSKVSNH